MLSLSALVSRRVWAGDGTRVGRLAELVVPAEDHHPGIRRLALRRGRGDVAWIEWDQVAAIDEAGLRLRPDAVVSASATEPAGGGGEIWLVRDVLDAQILDAGGSRLVRVADVLLIGEPPDLRVVGVDIGGAALLRRLGWHRRRPAPASAIDWDDLHLASGAGLATQLAARSEAATPLRPDELATVIANLSTHAAVDVLHSLPATESAAALGAAHPGVGARLVHALSEDAAVAVVEAMAPDDAVAALRGLPPDDLDRLLGRLGSSRAATLRGLLAHRPDTAGGLMTTEVRLAGVGETHEAILAGLVDHPPRTTSTATVVVVDEERRPVGVIDPMALLIGRPLQSPVPTVPAGLPVEQVIDVFATHDYLALPVVDGDGRLVGVIDVDDVMEELLAERLPGGRRFAHLPAGRRLPPALGRRRSRGGHRN